MNSLRDVAAAVEEQPVRELHDVRLVDRGHALAGEAAGVVEGEARDPGRGLLGDDLQALDDARHDLVLEAGVEILGVLADDDQIDVLEAARHAGEVAHRAQVGVEVERLAQPDVDAGEALADRRRHRPLQRHLVRPDRVEQRHRQRLSVLLEGDDAGVLPVPVDVETGGREDTDDGGGDLGTDAVAGNQRDGVSH